MALDGRHRQPGSVAVGLHLTEGNRTFGQTTIGMVHGIVGILPALVAQTTLGRTAVPQKTILLAGFRLANPGHRRIQGGLQLGNKGLVCRALQVIAGQDQKQGRGVDAAVVLGEGHLLERRHFSQAGFVQDLAGFGITGRIQMTGLLLG